MYSLSINIWWQLALVGLLPALSAPACAGEMSIRQQGRKLLISAVLPVGTRQIELRIESDRNDAITQFSKVSPDDTQRRQRIEKYARADTDTWYPVVDVVVEEGMYGVCRLSGSVEGEYTFGGPFYDDRRPLARTIEIPSERLEHWENSLRLPKATQVEAFHLRKTCPTLLDRFDGSVTTLSDAWRGTIEIWIENDGEQKRWARAIHRAGAENERGKELERLQGTPLTRQRLLTSLKAVIEDGRRRQNTRRASPTYGSFHTFYDLEAQTHRTSYWLWGGSPLVKMMIDALDHAEIEEEFGRESIIGSATLTGKLYLRNQVRDKNHPSCGSFLVIWTRSPTGYKKWVGTSDSGIMHRWAILPLYRTTGEAKYLESSRFWCEEKGRMLPQHEILPHYYLYDQQQFNDNILDETGWDPEGHAALYAITQEDRHRQIAKEYMDKHMAKFQNENGLWNRRYSISQDQASPPSRMTRGTGWAMEGLLAMNEMYPDTKYLEYAELMAAHLVNHQRSDGAWNFVFDAEAGSGNDVPSDKATPLWSFLFYRLYKATGNDEYLDVARRALEWCVENQYTGPDPEAVGGLVGRTNASMVGYRHFYPATCAYASGFLGLAILEELNTRE